jgi:hypothetical protein
MDAGEELEKTIAEYENTFIDMKQLNGDKVNLPWELAQRRLCSINAWTIEGAEEVTRLAREYGGFMLRNALALAKVMGVEDGELGY